MKFNLNIFLFLAILLVCNILHAQENHAIQSPWLTMKIEPQRKEINGVSIYNFNKEWDYFDLLSIDKVASFLTKNDLIFMNEKKFSFHIQKSGYDYFVGYYSTDSGSMGVFLAIFKGKKLLKFFSKPSNTVFSTLLLVNNKVLWYECIKCDSFETVRFSNGSFFLE